MEPSIRSICDYEFAKETAGWLYYLAPRNCPRNADVIMKKAMDAFRSKAEKNWFGRYEWIITEDEIYHEVDAIFKAIPEFVELNLSENEIERGVNVDDEDRRRFSFHSGYDVETEESVRDDFVDLDAFVQNVVCSLYKVTSNGNIQVDSEEQAKNLSTTSIEQEPSKE